MTGDDDIKTRYYASDLFGTKHRLDADFAAELFRAGNRLISSNERLIADVSVKAASIYQGDSDKKKRTLSNDASKSKNLNLNGVVFDPDQKYEPGAYFKHYVTERERKLALMSDDPLPNWGWMLPNGPKNTLPKPIRAVAKVTRYPVDPKTGKPMMSMGSEIQVKELGEPIGKNVGGNLNHWTRQASGVLMDALGKFRCPPGTPAANQFTDARGSNCFNFHIGHVVEMAGRLSNIFNAPSERNSIVQALMNAGVSSSRIRSVFERDGIDGLRSLAKLTSQNLVGDAVADASTRGSVLSKIQEALNMTSGARERIKEFEKVKNNRIRQMMDFYKIEDTGTEFGNAHALFEHMKTLGIIHADSSMFIGGTAESHRNAIIDETIRIHGSELSRLLGIDVSNIKTAYLDGSNPTLTNFINAAIARDTYVRTGTMKQMLFEMSVNPQQFKTFKGEPYLIRSEIHAIDRGKPSLGTNMEAWPEIINIYSAPVLVGYRGETPEGFYDLWTADGGDVDDQWRAITGALFDEAEMAQWVTTYHTDIAATMGSGWETFGAQSFAHELIHANQFNAFFSWMVNTEQLSEDDIKKMSNYEMMDAFKKFLTTATPENISEVFGVNIEKLIEMRHDALAGAYGQNEQQNALAALDAGDPTAFNFSKNLALVESLAEIGGASKIGLIQPTAEMEEYLDKFMPERFTIVHDFGGIPLDRPIPVPEGPKPSTRLPDSGPSLPEGAGRSWPWEGGVPRTPEKPGKPGGKKPKLPKAPKTPTVTRGAFAEENTAYWRDVEARREMRKSDVMEAIRKKLVGSDTIEKLFYGREGRDKDSVLLNSAHAFFDPEMEIFSVPGELVTRSDRASFVAQQARDALLKKHGFTSADVDRWEKMIRDVPPRKLSQSERDRILDLALDIRMKKREIEEQGRKIEEEASALAKAGGPAEKIEELKEAAKIYRAASRKAFFKEGSAKLNDIVDLIDNAPTDGYRLIKPDEREPSLRSTVGLASRKQDGVLTSAEKGIIDHSFDSLKEINNIVSKNSAVSLADFIEEQDSVARTVGKYSHQLPKGIVDEFYEGRAHIPGRPKFVEDAEKEEEILPYINSLLAEMKKTGISAIAMPAKNMSILEKTKTEETHVIEASIKIPDDIGQDVVHEIPEFISGRIITAEDYSIKPDIVRNSERIKREREVSDLLRRSEIDESDAGLIDLYSEMSGSYSLGGQAEMLKTLKKPMSQERKKSAIDFAKKKGWVNDDIAKEIESNGFVVDDSVVSKISRAESVSPSSEKKAEARRIHDITSEAIDIGKDKLASQGYEDEEISSGLRSSSGTASKKSRIAGIVWNFSAKRKEAKRAEEKSKLRDAKMSLAQQEGKEFHAEVSRRMDELNIRPDLDGINDLYENLSGDELNAEWNRRFGVDYSYEDFIEKIRTLVDEKDKARTKIVADMEKEGWKKTPLTKEQMIQKEIERRKNGLSPQRIDGLDDFEGVDPDGAWARTESARKMGFHDWAQSRGLRSSVQVIERPGKEPLHRTKDIKEAVQLMRDGKAVELDSVEKAYTLIDELHKIVKEAESKGEKAPNFDLCKVSVPGTNLFCEESLGIPRVNMPQFSGTPEAGSVADSLPKNKNGEVDGTKHFEEHLAKLGIKVDLKEVQASALRASQSELVGSKVAGMMNNPDFDPAGEAIFVSRDGYVIDGHHRWAAQVGRDIKDGELGDLPLRVRVVDMPISEVLKEANSWAESFGIKPKAAKHMWFKIVSEEEKFFVSVKQLSPGIGEKPGAMIGKGNNKSSKQSNVRITVPENSKARIKDDQSGKDNMLLPPGKIKFTGVGEDGVPEAEIVEQMSASDYMKNLEKLSDSLSSHSSASVRVASKKINKYSKEMRSAIYMTSKNSSLSEVQQRTLDKSQKIIDEVDQDENGLFNVAKISVGDVDLNAKEYVRRYTNSLGYEIANLKKYIKSAIFDDETDSKTRSYISSSSEQELLKAVDSVVREIHDGFDRRARLKITKSSLSTFMDNGKVLTGSANSASMSELKKIKSQTMGIPEKYELIPVDILHISIVQKIENMLFNRGTKIGSEEYADTGRGIELVLREQVSPRIGYSVMSANDEEKLYLSIEENDYEKISASIFGEIMLSEKSARAKLIQIFECFISGDISPLLQENNSSRFEFFVIGEISLNDVEHLKVPSSIVGTRGKRVAPSDPIAGKEQLSRIFKSRGMSQDKINAFFEKDGMIGGNLTPKYFAYLREYENCLELKNRIVSMGMPDVLITNPDGIDMYSEDTWVTPPPTKLRGLAALKEIASKEIEMMIDKIVPEKKPPQPLKQKNKETEQAVAGQ